MDSSQFEKHNRSVLYRVTIGRVTRGISQWQRRSGSRRHPCVAKLSIGIQQSLEVRLIVFKQQNDASTAGASPLHKSARRTAARINQQMLLALSSDSPNLTKKARPLAVNALEM